MEATTRHRSAGATSTGVGEPLPGAEKNGGDDFQKLASFFVKIFWLLLEKSKQILRFDGKILILGIEHFF